MRNRLLVIIGIIFCFVGLAKAIDTDFHEDQSLLEKILSEGMNQRFLKVRIQTLAKTIESLAKAPNSWDQPALFKISNQIGANFEFEAVKSGTFTEPPMCEDYEIHFAGTYSKERANSPWEVSSIEVKFPRRSQCL